jgi:hypothetical protein
MFDWDEHNLRKIRAHRIKREEVEQALLNDPEHDGRIRLVTAYDLDAGQKREFLTRRLREH